MSSSVSTTAGGVLVVTHVHPASQGAYYQPQGAHYQPQGAHQQPYVGTQKFIKGQPLALGTVQIMIGLMVLLFGFAMLTYADTLAVYSGIFVWGALLYITAGSLTVAAGKSLYQCLIKGSLAVNIIAAFASCSAVILHGIDAAIMVLCYGGSDWQSTCYIYESRMKGILGVLAVFHLLELILSLTVAGYACSATCNCSTEQPSVFVVPAMTTHVQGSVSPMQLPSQMVSCSKHPGEPGATGLPQPYTAVVC